MLAIVSREMGANLIDGEYQSADLQAMPHGVVPLSVNDPGAQDLLWQYAQRQRPMNESYARDLEDALRDAGFAPSDSLEEVTLQRDGREATVRAGQTLVTLDGRSLLIVAVDHQAGRLVMAATPSLIEVYDQMGRPCGMASDWGPIDIASIAHRPDRPAQPRPVPVMADEPVPVPGERLERLVDDAWLTALAAAISIAEERRRSASGVLGDQATF